MPMGLTNTPATCQRLMEMVLCGLPWKTCLVYLGDVLIYSRSFSEHLVATMVLTSEQPQLHNKGKCIEPDVHSVAPAWHCPNRFDSSHLPLSESTPECIVSSTMIRWLEKITSNCVPISLLVPEFLEASALVNATFTQREQSYGQLLGDLW